MLAVLLIGCTPQPAPNEEFVTIGFIGCSNTRETVEGYHHVGGIKIWDAQRRYGSGTVLDWSKNPENSIYWDTFDTLLKKYPKTKIIWWQLCIMDGDRATSKEHADIVFNEIYKRIPDAVIYVSALADYTDGVCSITGTWGLEKSKQLSIELSTDGVLPGPVLGPMSAIETAEDNCHLSSPDGKRVLGLQMKAFFDDGFQKPNEAATENESTAVKENNSTQQIEEAVAIEESQEPQFEHVWQERIDAALEETECPPIKEISYPEGSYLGPLTDTHLHIPSIPDWSDEPSSDETEGRFGGPGAFLGWNVKMSEIACTIQHEGTTKNFAFFPAYEDQYEYQLSIWKKTMDTYPKQFTPFIMSSGNDDDPDGFPTVDAKTLKSMLAVYPNMFEGYGEIGLYQREGGGSPALAPDSIRMKEIYPLIREHVVYIHLGDNQKGNFERTLKANPDINFVWHGDQLSINEIEDVLSRYPNAHYGIEIIGEGGKFGIFPLFVGKSKQEYIDEVNRKFEDILRYDVRTWKPVIERHPDQIVWGTDRADAEWNYDLEVGQLMVKYARAFTGKLDPAVQEKFAYKNAEKLVMKK